MQNFVANTMKNLSNVRYNLYMKNKFYQTIAEGIYIFHSLFILKEFSSAKTNHSKELKNIRLIG
jgi:hypothetical protein